MRPVRVDLAGTTDASGNATIKVPLPFTGAWYNVKFSLSLSDPAEWAVLVSGTVLTYGRGRRVTLGPELIQDGETVTITVTTGPPTAAIIGSMNGAAGTPTEMLSSYAPQPNTISVDTAAEVQLLKSIQGVGPVTTTGIPIPKHANAVGYVLNAGPGAATSINLSGEQTGITYLTHTAAQFQNTPIAVLLDPRDTTLKVIVGSGAGSWGIFDILAWQAPSQVWAKPSPGDTFPISGPVTPQLWQAPTKIVRVSATTVTTVSLLAGVANQVIRVWGWQLQIDNQSAGTSIGFLEDAGSGNFIAAITTRVAAEFGNDISGNLKGAPLDTVGGGLQLHVIGLGTGAAIRAVAAVSQG